MFDQLIESERNGARKNTRSRYFVVSTFLTAVLFLSAVLMSIYAADIDIGADRFELTQLLAPVPMNEPEPERPATQKSSQNSSAAVTDTVVRRAPVQRMDEAPSEILPVSNIPSKYMERPLGNYKIGTFDSGPAGQTGPSTTVGTPGGTGIGQNSGDPGTVGDKPVTTPPPALKAKEEPPVVASLGVVNGIARSLPQPQYPKHALAAGAGGLVQVQILIDTDGSVISSRAINGHPLLKRVAEDAARRAKFTTTYLSNKPVKATGLISYNFKRE